MRREYMPPMAAIEADLGVLATYCVHVDSRWYSIDTAENRAAITETLAHGHRLGLHFDASSIESDAQARRRHRRAGAPSRPEFSLEVRVVSFHMPGRRRVDHLVALRPGSSTRTPRVSSSRSATCPTRTRTGEGSTLPMC